jgi:3-oxoacyl-[acyl-carrier protein] reductase
MSELVIVTGTSGRLGAAIARRAVGDGFDVVGVARRPVDPSSISPDGSRYHHIEFDLSAIDDIGALVARIVNDFGKPYALVNNAAVGTDGLLPTMHNADIDAAIRLNVTSPIVLTKYVVRHMLTLRRGRVVNISSIVARTGYRGLAVYGASKAAMEGFTRSLARDIGRRNVTVNAVAPGFLETDMTAGLGDQLERIVNRSALGRFADVDEVAASVSYLLSDGAAGVTGTTLTVDAGSTA